MYKKRNRKRKTRIVSDLNNFTMEFKAHSNSENIQMDNCSDSNSKVVHKQKILQTLNRIDLNNSNLSSISIYK